MEAQVAPDRRVTEPAPGQDRRAAQGAGGDHDLPGANGERPGRGPGPVRIRAAEGRLHPDDPAAIDQDPLDPGVGDEPRAAQGGVGEVGLEARALRPGPAPERARPATGAAAGVAFRRCGFDAQDPGAGDQHRVLGRHGRCLGDPQLAPDRGVVGITLGPVEALQAVVARPFPANVRRRAKAGHPVDRRAAADARPGQDRDRAVPGRGQAVIEVEPVEGRQLVGRHRRLGHERGGFEDEDRAAGRRQLAGDDTGPGARADDAHVGLQDDAVARAWRQADRLDRRRVAGQRCAIGPVAHPGPVRVGHAALAGIGVGQEAEQPAQGLEGAPALGEAGGPPGQQVALTGRRREIAEAGRTGAQDEVDDRPLEQAQDEPELADLLRVGRQVERRRGEVGPPGRRAADERLGNRGERRQLLGRPRPARRGGRQPGGDRHAPVVMPDRPRPSAARSPGPATARSAAAGPRDSRGRNRPGSACAAGWCLRR